jgi:hypothetical protein
MINTVRMYRDIFNLINKELFMMIIVRTRRKPIKAEYDAIIELQPEYSLEQMQKFLQNMPPYLAAKNAGVCYRTIKRVIEDGPYVTLKRTSIRKISNYMNDILVTFATPKPPQEDEMG